MGGENLKSLGIKSIYDLKEITYLGFTNVFLNLFKINKKINQTVESVLKYKPDILFTVDSPDFTLRVAEKVKKMNSKLKLFIMWPHKFGSGEKTELKKLKSLLIICCFYLVLKKNILKKKM